MDVVYEATVTIHYWLDEKDVREPDRMQRKTVRMIRLVTIPPGIPVPQLRVDGADIPVIRTTYDPISRMLYAVVENCVVPFQSAKQILKLWKSRGFNTANGFPTSDFLSLDSIFREVLW